MHVSCIQRNIDLEDAGMGLFSGRSDAALEQTRWSPKMHTGIGWGHCELTQSTYNAVLIALAR